MEVVSFNVFRECISKDLKIKDIKKIIENQTGIKEENQIFHVYCQFSG